MEKSQPFLRITHWTEVSYNYAESMVPHHLLTPVRDVRMHRGHPFQGGEALTCSAIFGWIDDLSLLIPVLHSFLRERYPDAAAGQIFHGRIIFWRYAGAAEGVEDGMPPCGEQGDHLRRLIRSPVPRWIHLVMKSCPRPDRGMVSSFFRSRGGVTRNMPLTRPDHLSTAWFNP